MLSDSLAQPDAAVALAAQEGKEFLDSGWFGVDPRMDAVWNAMKDEYGDAPGLILA